jgi:methionine salvage enolase-phosphatase E1
MPTSLVELAQELQVIPVQSVMFYFQRQDFQKWLKKVVGDEELSKRIDQIKECRSALSSDENLKKTLSKTVQYRIAKLQRRP